MVDEATSDALKLFNARLGAQAENEKAERRVQKAAKAKDDAAGRVRNLENDTTATAEQRAEAAAAYRAAVEAWERARNGEADPTPAAPVAENAAAEDAAAEDAPVEDAAAEDAPFGEDAPAEDAPEPQADAPVAEAPAEAESADEPDGAAPTDH